MSNFRPEVEIRLNLSQKDYVRRRDKCSEIPIKIRYHSDALKDDSDVIG